MVTGNVSEWINANVFQAGQATTANSLCAHKNARMMVCVLHQTLVSALRDGQESIAKWLSAMA